MIMRLLIFTLDMASSRIDLSSLEVIEGELPRRALSLVQEWAMIHREELVENWELCREKSQPTKIDPLP